MLADSSGFVAANTATPEETKTKSTRGPFDDDGATRRSESSGPVILIVMAGQSVCHVAMSTHVSQ